MTNEELAKELETWSRNMAVGTHPSFEPTGCGLLRQAAGRLRKLEEIAKAAEKLADIATVSTNADFATPYSEINILRAALSSLKEGD